MAGRPSAEILAVETRGLAELDAAWTPWERGTEAALRDATFQIAQLTATVTQLRVPVLTGRFRASIRAERLEQATPAAKVVEGEGLEYGRWLEYGRRKRGKAPKGGRYLVPTAKREKRVFKQHLAATTEKEIHSYPWPKPAL